MEPLSCLADHDTKMVFPFLYLPAEIRIDVYRALLIVKGVYMELLPRSLMDANTPPHASTIFRTCRQICEEASAIFYNECQFLYSPMVSPMKHYAFSDFGCVKKNIRRNQTFISEPGSRQKERSIHASALRSRCRCPFGLLRPTGLLFQKITHERLLLREPTPRQASHAEFRVRSGDSGRTRRRQGVAKDVLGDQDRGKNKQMYNCRISC